MCVVEWGILVGMRLPFRQEPLQLMQMLGEVLEKEARNWKPCLYRQPPKQVTEIGAEDRDAIIRWLAQLSKKFKFYPETLSLSTAILDQFLQSVKARPKYLRCIGFACFYLAAKTLEEDEVIPETLELVRKSECGCTVSEVLRMERIILDKLEWQLRLVTPLDFLHIFHALLVTKNPHVFGRMPREQMLRQLTVLTRQLQAGMACHQMLAFRPATVALAVLSLGLEMCTPDWLRATLWLQMLTKVNNESLIRCREEVSHCLEGDKKSNTIYWYSVHSGRAAKRKVAEVDDDDIYDGIKRLYNEEIEQTNVTTSSTTSCGREIVNESTTPPQLQAVAN